MSSIKLQVKWGKKVFDDVDLNLEDDITTFKCQLYALTNVPIEK
jgi:ubiquitin carboxyl-terminal hydrolase 14